MNKLQKNKRYDNFQTNCSMNNYLLNSYQYLQKGYFTPFPAVFFFSFSSISLSNSFLSAESAQGWLKSTRISYLNTGSFPRNHIWMCGVLKKSIFAYLKFHICIPKILHSCYHRPYPPCPNFSVPASVKARSSLVYNVFHQNEKIRTSRIHFMVNVKNSDKRIEST